MKTPSKKEIHEWNEEREKLEAQLLEMAEKLVDHMGSCNVRGDFEIEIGGGRTLRVNVYASPRLRPH